MAKPAPSSSPGLYDPHDQFVRGSRPHHGAPTSSRRYNARGDDSRPRVARLPPSRLRGRMRGRLVLGPLSRRRSSGPICRRRSHRWRSTSTAWRRRRSGAPSPTASSSTATRQRHLVDRPRVHLPPVDVLRRLHRPARLRHSRRDRGGLVHAVGAFQVTPERLHESSDCIGRGRLRERWSPSHGLAGEQCAPGYPGARDEDVPGAATAAPRARTVAVRSTDRAVPSSQRRRCEPRLAVVARRRTRRRRLGDATQARSGWTD
jgi:hypothetical protein